MTIDDTAAEDPMIFNLGKAKKKQLKRLKKGKGPLMDEIDEAVSLYKTHRAKTGEIVVPLVFIVKEKRPRASSGGFFG